MPAIHVSPTFLPSVIFDNALFSGLSGLLLIAATSPVADLLGTDALWALQLIGFGLMLYACWLALGVMRQPIDPRNVWLAIMLDMGWVVGSGLILLAGWQGIPPASRWTIGFAADLVACFALLQIYGLRHMWREEKAR